MSKSNIELLVHAALHVVSSEPHSATAIIGIALVLVLVYWINQRQNDLSPSVIVEGDIIQKGDGNISIDQSTGKTDF
jgi:hypothetical protein